MRKLVQKMKKNVKRKKALSKPLSKHEKRKETVFI